MSMVRVAYSEHGCRCGESNPRARLSNAEVDEIRDDYEVDGLTPREISRKRGVSFHTVCALVYYRRRNVIPVRYGTDNTPPARMAP